MPFSVCEIEAAMASNIAADIALTLPEDRFQVVQRVVDDPASLLRTRSKTPVLFTPRVWGDLESADRANPRAHELRFVFEADELSALGEKLGWTAS